MRRPLYNLPMRFLAVTLAAVAFASGMTAQSPPPAARTHLVIVVDGLRPDYITPALMPRLVRLGQRGIVFNAHHSVFPTVTRVNASSIATGTYPETHGLLGNNVYVPSVNPTRGLDTGSRANLEQIARAEPRLLTAPSLGEILQQAGRKILAVGSGTSGAALLLNHTVANGAVLHHEFTLPSSLASHTLDVLGPPPAHALPNAAQNRRAVDAYLKLGLEELHPDVTLMWISDPDTTAHTRGIGAPATRESLTLADGEIGRIEDTLQAKGLLARTNLIVTADHGFSTHTSALKLESLVEPFAHNLPDGSRDIVVSEGAIYLRPASAEPVAPRVAAIVAALQRRPEVGAIFTRPGARGGPEGVVPGTLSYDVGRWNHPRSGDILVSANWSRDANDAGYEGKTAQNGTAGHGTSSPYDIHIPLVAAGPDFRERAVSDVPTGNVDLAPTLVRLLGLPVPKTMTGRVIEEGLRGGAPRAVPVARATETVKTADGSYELTAHISIAAGHHYLDFTEVKRR